MRILVTLNRELFKCFYLCLKFISVNHYVDKIFFVDDLDDLPSLIVLLLFKELSRVVGDENDHENKLSESHDSGKAKNNPEIAPYVFKIKNKSKEVTDHHGPDYPNTVDRLRESSEIYRDNILDISR